jgi:putative phage-type endonuclease
MAAPRVLTNTAGMGRDEWLAWRRQGLGASDAAAVLGQDPWTSPWSLWIDKRGELPDDTDDNEAMRFGVLLEAVVAEEVSRRTGLEVRRRNAILQHRKHQWMVCNPDRLLRDPTRGDQLADPLALPQPTDLGQGLLEIKTTSAYNAADWRDGHAPLHYHLQVQHGLAVTDLTWGVLACLVGGQQLVIRWIERDDELVSHLREAQRRFWYDHVQAGVPPPIDGSDSTRRALERLYAEPDPTRFGAELDGDAVDAARRYRAAHQRIKTAEAEKEQAGNELRAALGDFEAGHEPDAPLDSKPLVEWRTITQTQLDTKTLRLEQPDIAAKYDTTTHQRRLTVRDPKE